MQLDSELNFLSHIKEAIAKARRGIGMIRFLSKYVARDVLDQIYKLYVRPHLDYGDIIYHKYDPEMRLTFQKKINKKKIHIAEAVIEESDEETLLGITLDTKLSFKSQKSKSEAARLI